MDVQIYEMIDWEDVRFIATVTLQSIPIIGEKIIIGSKEYEVKSISYKCDEPVDGKIDNVIISMFIG